MAAYSRRNDFDFNRKTNPFEDDSDDEFEKVNGDEIRTQMQLSRDRTLDSTKRSLALIEDSHDIACRTGEELSCQGEQLNRVERNLDKIQSDMSIANRHIRSVNSIFGAIGNYFKKAPKPKETTEQTVPDSRLSALQEDPSQYYPDYRSESKSGGYEAGISRGGGQFQSTAYSSRDPREREIEANLDLVSRGIGLLKEDALILGNEIGRQNDQLDRINVKADKAHSTVEESDKKVRRILRK
ncbi:synaptosomal-associated protein 29-like [Oculina patagonica]